MTRYQLGYMDGLDGEPRMYRDKPYRDGWNAGAREATRHSHRQTFSRFAF